MIKLRCEGGEIILDYLGGPNVIMRIHKETGGSESEGNVKLETEG